MQSLGSIDVGPSDLDIEIGPVTLPAGADALFVRMTQTYGESPWLFSFGLLSWRTTNGRELGTVKAYPHKEGELYRLRTGLSPVERGGSLWFTPRAYNLSWIKSGHGLGLRFEWEAGSDGDGGGGGGGGVSGYAGGFVNTAGAGLELARVVFP
jgi:hypothetical protein